MSQKNAFPYIIRWDIQNLATAPRKKTNTCFNLKLSTYLVLTSSGPFVINGLSLAVSVAEVAWVSPNREQLTRQGVELGVCGCPATAGGAGRWLPPLLRAPFPFRVSPEVSLFHLVGQLVILLLPFRAESVPPGKVVVQLNVRLINFLYKLLAS